ncbi:MAG: PrgI family protein [Candidatus Magasanikbacteria bacterium]|nr:PrgI family protein [Candidatus Magasanikbacteria bacterium]
MQQFVVPQFIDVEDKIFGPITVRQFLILLAGGLLVFLAFKYADFALFITSLIVVGGGSLIVAFVKINGQTFHYFILNLLQTVRRPGLRVWRKNYDKDELNYLRLLEPPEIEIKEVRKAARSEHIRDLALIVNTGGFYRPEEDL